MKFLLDTDHISLLERQSGPECAIVMVRVAQNDPADIAFSVVSFHEQALGCHTYILRAKDSAAVVRGYAMLDRVIRNFSAAPVLPFDSGAAEIYDRLNGRRIRVGTMDLRIAAIAISRNLVLVTRNRGHFAKISGLKLEDWTR